MTQKPLNPVTEMIRHISQQILERLLRGEVVYRRDMRTLTHHLKLSKELDDPLLPAQLQDVIAFVDSEVGNINRAIDYWNNAYQIYKDIDHTVGMAWVRNNLGEFYYRLGDSEKAQAAYEDARALAETIEDTEIIMRVEGNLGLLWLHKKDYINARICFSLVVAVTEFESWQHIYTLVNARRGLAEVYLANEDYKKAWQEANLAEGLASGRQLNLMLAQVYQTKAHIAQYDDDAPEPAEYYYRESQLLLREHGNFLLLARNLMSEAHYQRQRKAYGKAIESALEARDLFVKLALKGEIEISEAFLAEVDAEQKS